MLNAEFYIGNCLIRNGAKPFLIAEAGSNHNQSLDSALKLVETAAKAGAHAVKFQLFEAERLYPYGTELYNIFRLIELNRDWVPKLAEHAKDCGIEFMASAFDKDAVDLLDDLSVSAFKIASSETVNLPLLAHIARTGRPIIMSTGMCDMVDIITSVDFCQHMGVNSIALLQCGAVYPLSPEQAHLRVMDVFRDFFGCPVGFSDHTIGYTVAMAAVARGACIIEKHFTLDKKSEGPDHFYSVEPDELSEMFDLLRKTYVSLGRGEKTMLPEEKEVGRREGLYAARNLWEGEVLVEEDIEIRRPAIGLRKRHIGEITGCSLSKDLPKGAPLNWDDVLL